MEKSSKDIIMIFTKFPLREAAAKKILSLCEANPPKPFASPNCHSDLTQGD